LLSRTITAEKTLRFAKIHHAMNVYAVRGAGAA